MGLHHSFVQRVERFVPRWLIVPGSAPATVECDGAFCPIPFLPLMVATPGKELIDWTSYSGGDWWAKFGQVGVIETSQRCFRGRSESGDTALDVRTEQGHPKTPTQHQARLPHGGRTTRVRAVIKPDYIVRG